VKTFLGEYPRKCPGSQWETIPYQRANDGEGPTLHGGGASKWDMKEALLSRVEVAGTPNAKERATKVSKVGLLGSTRQGQLL